MTGKGRRVEVAADRLGSLLIAADTLTELEEYTQEAQRRLQVLVED